MDFHAFTVESIRSHIHNNSIPGKNQQEEEIQAGAFSTAADTFPARTP